MTLTVWRSLIECSIGICLLLLLWLDCGCKFGGGGPQRWSTILITSHQRYMLAMQCVTIGADPGHLRQQCVPGLFTGLLLFSPHYLNSTFWKGVTKNSSHSRGRAGGNWIASLGGEIIYTIMWAFVWETCLFSFIHSLINSSFIYVSMESWEFISYFAL